MYLTYQSTVITSLLASAEILMCTCVDSSAMRVVVNSNIKQVQMDCSYFFVRRILLLIIYFLDLIDRVIMVIALVDFVPCTSIQSINFNLFSLFDV